MKRIFTSLLLALPMLLCAQTAQQQLEAYQKELQGILEQKQQVEGKIEGARLTLLREDLQKFGLPALDGEETVIHHQAMSLCYSEEHEQAKWVAHIILPQILEGEVGRTNDFRPDPKISTGTCVEEDYFLKYIQPDSSFEYDGFGYDRGHLAPSADFRWSRTALSESYFYSNMSPQAPDFNRGIWADLEKNIRGYIYRNPESRLFVVTGPVLSSGLPAIERSINKPSIPRKFFKVVVDIEKRKGIGFLLPNEKSDLPLASFAKSIDEIERIIEMDFFPGIPNDLESQLESQSDTKDWIPQAEQADVKPLFAPDLPRGHFNTNQAKMYIGKGDEITVCGKVVSARRSQKGNILLNLDRAYPNSVFTVFIRKENIVNFSYDPEEAWKGKYVKVTGEVGALGKTPTMFIEKEAVLEAFVPKKR